MGLKSALRSPRVRNRRLRILRRAKRYNFSVGARKVLPSYNGVTLRFVCHQGYMSPSPQDDVNILDMWACLENLVASPKLGLHLNWSDVSKSVPIILAQGRSSSMQEIPAVSLLAGSKESELLATTNTDRSAGSTQEVQFLMHQDVRIRRGPHGQGFIASCDLPVGTTVLIEKPAVAVLDGEMHRRHAWADVSGADICALQCNVAGVMRSKEGSKLSDILNLLHPRGKFETSEASGSNEDTEDDDAILTQQMHSEVEAAFSTIAGGAELRQRIEAVLRLNCFGFYTNSEQFCYQKHYQKLTGTGLYPLASIFNHSCAPNVNRFSIGDVCFFRTIMPVSAGTELLISYVRSDLLCEPLEIRRIALNRDFECGCSKCQAQTRAAKKMSEGEHEYFDFEEEFKGVLMSMPALLRIKVTKGLLQGDLPGGQRGSKVLFKDSQEIRSLLALALMECGRLTDAWDVWAETAKCIVSAKCHDFDESLCCCILHAAFCAAGNDMQEAVKCLRIALDLHRICFGGQKSDSGDGRFFFSRHYAGEIQLIKRICPKKVAKPQDQLIEWLGLPSEPEGEHIVNWRCFSGKIMDLNVPNKFK